MKPIPLVVILLAATGLCADAFAGGPDSGFFLGGAGQIQFVNGTGTWAEYDFEITEPLSVEGGGPVGLSWTDKMLLGIKPMAGYKINPKFELQVGYALNIPKSAQHTYTESSAFSTYEQGYSAEWKQRSLEILGVFHPNPDLGYFIYAGLDLTSIETEITLYEGISYQDFWGDLISEVDSNIQSDDISATGFIFGGGLEFPSDSKKSTVFLSAQYSTAKTDGTYFATDDFKVNVGGLSVMVGVKWFPFVEGSPESSEPGQAVNLSE